MSKCVVHINRNKWLALTQAMYTYFYNYLVAKRQIVVIHKSAIACTDGRIATRIVILLYLWSTNFTSYVKRLQRFNTTELNLIITTASSCTN